MLEASTNYSITSFNIDNFKPMLALTVDLSKITYPSLLQLKFDSNRLLFIDYKLYSRNMIDLTNRPALKHIINDLIELKKVFNYNLDGELYSKSLTHEEINSLIKINDGSKLT